MPFRFKLQKILDYREQLEEEAKVDLANKQKLLEEARALFERLKAELRQTEDRLFESALVPQAERWLLEQYVKGLRGDVANAALQTRMHEQLVDEARKLLAARAIEKNCWKSSRNAKTSSIFVRNN